MLSARRLVGVALAALVLAACTGCPKPPKPAPPVVEKPDYFAELPPGERALVKLEDPALWPDFSAAFGHPEALEQAAHYSLEYMTKRSSQGFYPYAPVRSSRPDSTVTYSIPHDQAVASIQEFVNVLRSARSPQEFDETIKSRFDIYMSRGCDEKGTVLFTGYYRPIFDASMTRTEEFQYPLYRKPPDLQQDPATFKYSREGGGPYYTRSEIDRGALAGKNLELCWLRDRFEAYIVTIQGSGKLRLPDGRFLEIGYAGDNGYEYASIGQDLVKRGVIQPEQLSLQGLIDFYKANPQELDTGIQLNQRFVFFTERPGGPYGSLNVPVTPFCSIATDKEVYPRACVAFMQTLLPARDPSGQISQYQYSGFALDQDTGGAIRAAGRCDVFMGTGPAVGQLAGRTFSEGRLYYIFVKSVEGNPPVITEPAAPPMPEAPPADPTAPMQ